RGLTPDPAAIAVAGLALPPARPRRVRGEALRVQQAAQRAARARVVLQVELVRRVDAAEIDQRLHPRPFLRPAEEPAHELAAAVVVPGAVLADREREAA